MKSSLIATVLSFLCLVAHAQMPTDTIEIRKKQYMVKGVALTGIELVQLISLNPESAKEIKMARRKLMAASVFGGIGGGLIGFPIGTELGGGKPDWTLAAVGAGVILVAVVPFSRSANRHLKAAVDIYNRDIKMHSHAVAPVSETDYSK